MGKKKLIFKADIIFLITFLLTNLSLVQKGGYSTLLSLGIYRQT